MPLAKPIPPFQFLTHGDPRGGVDLHALCGVWVADRNIGLYQGFVAQSAVAVETTLLKVSFPILPGGMARFVRRGRRRFEPSPTKGLSMPARTTLQRIQRLAVCLAGGAACSLGSAAAAQTVAAPVLVPAPAESEQAENPEPIIVYGRAQINAQEEVQITWLGT